ncbi:helix-turn-helix domain-containing protein [Roseinatronobacter sp. S2]|uniref:helix-turn-helix domain-containing protein n=1 Tax=Roseinatronobacter sp. S2 TaxID=3035471 RepID=UPI00240FB3C0|nr:helix-turn-helix domain-containing protein [Roseinatronobacter sp. S2]WFE75615.1 helix-turn-helix domain-containing protein [Roseinatronobacter sp. S2]
MQPQTHPTQDIPAWHLYGERAPFPDLVHMERIIDRAAGLDWQIRPHRHTHLLQIFLLLSGQITFHAEGQSRSLVPPVALCLPPTAVHGFDFSAGTEGWVLSLPVQNFPEFLADGAELAFILQAPAAFTPGTPVHDSFMRLFDVWSGNERFRSTELRCVLGQILCTLFRDQGIPPAADLKRSDPRITKFQSLIAVHANAHWAVSRYAHELGMSTRNLGRLCKQHTGLSPQAMIEAHLMREAARLLAYTRMSAQSIAHRLGYDDPSYFNRRFRAFANMSPGAYRRRLEQ